MAITADDIKRARGTTTKTSKNSSTGAITADDIARGRSGQSSSRSTKPPSNRKIEVAPSTPAVLGSNGALALERLRNPSTAMPSYVAEATTRAQSGQPAPSYKQPTPFLSRNFTTETYSLYREIDANIELMNQRTKAMMNIDDLIIKGAELNAQLSALSDVAKQAGQTIPARADFLKSVASEFVETGADMALSGMYGAMAMAEEAIPNVGAAGAKRGLEIAAQLGYDTENLPPWLEALTQDYVSPFRQDAEDFKASAEERSARNKQGLSPTQGMLVDLAGSAGNMLFTSGMMGMATGATVKPATLADINKLAISAGAGGQSYIDAIQAGAGVNQAAAYGILTGAVEYASESLFGGNPLVDKDSGLVNRAIAKICKNTKLLNFLASQPIEILNEGLEEIIAEIANPAIQYLTYTKTPDPLTLDRIIEAYIGGVVIGGVMTGGSHAINAAYGNLGGDIYRDPEAVFAEPTQVAPTASEAALALESTVQEAPTAQVRAEVTPKDVATARKVLASSTAAEDNVEGTSTATQQKASQKPTEGGAEQQAVAPLSDYAFENLKRKVLAPNGKVATIVSVRTDAMGNVVKQDIPTGFARVRYGNGSTEVVNLKDLKPYSAAAQQKVGAVTAADVADARKGLSNPQESVSDTGAITELEGIDNGEQGNESGRRGEQRYDGLAADKPGGRVQKGARASQTGQATQGSRAESIRVAVKTQGVVNQSTADQGFTAGTAKETLSVVPAELYTQELNDIAREQNAAGRQVTFIVGELELKDRDGKTFHARGAISADGKHIWVRADHNKLTATQISKHETFHAIVKSDSDAVRRVRNELIANRRNEELLELANAYIDTYGWTDVDLDYVLEEMLADAYAGIDIFDYLTGYEGATRLSDTVQKAANERGAASERGPPTEDADVRFSVDAAEAEKHAADAEEYYGTTTDFREAGWLTINGKLLDFSGKKDGGEPGHRYMDHIDIQYIMDGYDRMDAYNRFMFEGNVRLLPEYWGINISADINENQASVLRTYINRAGGEVILDITSETGSPLTSHEYAKRTASSKILNDIKAYFKDGTKPTLSEVAKWRYSQEDSEGNKLTEEQAEFFKDSKVRDEAGNLKVVYHGTPSGGFTVFDPKYLSMESRTSQQGTGFYFTDNRKWASEYQTSIDIYGRKSKGRSPAMYETYLNITKPLDISGNERTLTDQQLRDIISRSDYQYGKEWWKWYLLKDKTRSDEDGVQAYLDYFKEKTDKQILQDVHKWFRFDNASGLMTAFREVTGYDGIAEHQTAGDIWVATSSEQVKNVSNTSPTEDPDIRFSLAPPYNDNSKEEKAFAEALAPEARKTYDLFKGVYDAATLMTDGKKVNIAGKFMRAEQWNNKLKKNSDWNTAARVIAEAIPEKVRKVMHMDAAGRLSETPMEKELRLSKSIMQRTADALLVESVPSTMNIDGREIRITDGRTGQSVGGEAYRHALVEERRKLFKEGSLKEVTIASLSKDRWGGLGFLAENGKTSASGDMTTYCPQMYFNKGCFYCYRRAAMETGLNNKLVAENLWYSGEILHLSKADIDQLNLVGGLRIQSFGDWMIQFTPMFADILYDAQTKGLQVKVITKEPAMIETVQRLREQGLGLNLYFNISVDYVIEKAGLPNEAWQRLNPDRPYMRDDNGQMWWKRALSVQEADALRKKYPWVNCRIVATNIAEFIRGLKDTRVDVVTGYHGNIREYERISSETGEHLVEVEPLGDSGMPKFNYDDDTGIWTVEDEGRTKYHKELSKAIRAEGLEYEYYIKACCITGRCISCKGLCGKFSRYFNTKNATNRDTQSRAYWQENMQSAVPNAALEDDPDIRYSMEDSEGNELTAEQVAFFADSKVRDADGKLIPMYHGTNTPNFTVFDPSFSDDKISLFFTDNPQIADTYTSTQDHGDTVDPYRLPNTIKTADEFNAYMEERNKPYRIFKVTDELIEKVSEDISAAGEGKYVPSNLLAQLEKVKGKYIPYNGEFNYIARDDTAFASEYEAVKQETDNKHWTPHRFGNKYKLYLNLENPYTIEGGTKHSGKGTVSFTAADLSEGARMVIEIGEEEFAPGIGHSDSALDILRDIVDTKSFAKIEKKIARNREKNIKEDMEMSSRSRESAINFLDKYGMIDYGLKVTINDADINYIEPGHWKSVRYGEKTGTTREITRWAKDNGYDGVVIKNVRDIGGYSGGTVNAKATIAVAFSPEQIKSVDNKNPTEDSDIRYSREESAFSDLRDQNEELREKVSYWQGQTKLTEKITTRRSDIDKIARRLIDGTVSKAEPGPISVALQELYDFISQGGNEKDELTWPGVKTRALDIAYGLVINAEELANEDSAMVGAAIRKHLKGMRLSISRQDAADIDDFNDFRKRNFGTFSIAVVEKGDAGRTPVDTAYLELTETFGEGFFPTSITHPAEQLRQIADVVRRLMPMYENPHSFHMAEAAEYVANEIIESYFDARQTAPTFADRQAAKLTEQEIAAKKRLDNLREEKNARIETLRAAWKERVAQAIKQERTRRIEQVETLKAHYRAREANARESRNARELRAKITRHVKDLSEKLLKPTDKRHVPESLRAAVAAVLEAINLESNYTVDADTGKRSNGGNGSPMKRTESFRALKAEYSRVLKSGEALVIDPDLIGDSENPGNLDVVISMADIRIADMNTQQLDIIWQTIRAVEASVANANKMLGQSRFANVSDMGEAIRQDTANRKTKTERWGLFGWPDRVLSMEMLKPVDNFHRLGKAGDSLWRELREAQDNFTRHIAQAQNDIEKMFGGADVKEWGGKGAPMNEFTLESGEKLKLTPAQAMGLYLLAKRPQALEHILIGGVRQGETERKGSKVARGTEPVRITIFDIGKIAASLTAEQTRVADGIGKYASTTLSEWGNEASMTVYGYKKFLEEFYWPIKSDPSYLKTESGKGVDVTIKGRGFTKQTVQHASNAIVINDALDTFAQHVNDMATYSAWLAAIEDAERVMNFRFRTETGDVKGSVKETISRAFGNAGLNYFDLLLEDINQGVKTKADASTLNALSANYKAAAVGANIRVVVQQPTSILRAAAIIDTKYLVAGALRKGNWALVKKWAPIAQWKDWGYFDIETGRQMKDILLETDTALAKTRELAMAAAAKADSITWGKIWNACEAEVSDKRSSLKKGSDEYYRAVAERFNEVIDKSQVVDGILQRNQIMRSTSDIARMASSFMSEPVTTYSMLASALDDFINTDGKTHQEAGKRLARTALAVVLADVVCSALASFVDALRDDDKEQDYWQKWVEAFVGLAGDEEGFGEYLKAIISGNLVSQINPAAKIPFVKDILSLLSGYDITRMDMDAFSKLIESAQRAVKAIGGTGTATIGAAIADLTASVARVFGVPIYSIKRDVTAIIDSTLQAIGNWEMMYRADKLLYAVGSTANKGRYYDLLFYAWQEEDKTQYNAIRRDMRYHGYDPDNMDDAIKDRLEKTDEYSAAAGPVQERIVGAIARNKAYGALPKEYKIKATDYAEDYANAKTMLEQNPDYELPNLYKWILEADGGADAGVDPAEYILFKAAVAKLDDERETAKEALPEGEKLEDDYQDLIEALLDEMPLNDDERYYLFGTKYDSDENNPYRW